MAAAKTIDIIGRSTTSSDDAVRQALDEARRTVRNITGVDVVSKGLRGDDLREWRALIRVAFVVDRGDERPTGARRSAAAEAAALRLEEREG
jgi:dodecin